MPEESDEKARNLIEKGLSLTGTTLASVSGAAVGLFLGGPAGAIVGAAVTPALTEGANRVIKDIAGRWLSPQEEARIGAGAQFIAATVRQRLDAGGLPRNDGFFETHDSDRPKAEEILEGVFLKCRDAYEQKKIRLIANVFANAAFTDISPNEVNYVLSLAERLTYRQLCVLSLMTQRMKVGFDSRLLHKLAPAAPDADLNEQRKRSAARNTTLAREIDELTDLFIPTTDDPISYVEINHLGKRIFDLLGLDEIPREDLDQVIEELKQIGEADPPHSLRPDAYSRL